jgi:predicted TIM-barrel fold metal-dependent hydrolase
MLDEHPNLYVDIAARVVELGRHDPKKLREVFVRHRKRILFGTDLGVSPGDRLMLGSSGEEPNKREEVGPFFTAHYRWLETKDTQPSPTPIQGRWDIKGIDLPVDVLEDVYFRNAERLFEKPSPASARSGSRTPPPKPARGASPDSPP